MDFKTFYERYERQIIAIILASVFLIIANANSPTGEIGLVLKTHPTLLLLTVSAYIAFIGYRHSRRQACAKNTIDFQTYFHQSESLNSAASVFQSKLSKLTTKELEELAKNGSRDDELNLSARELLNSWERVAVAVKHEVYDENMLYNVYASFLLSIASVLSPYIKEKQKINPRWYVEFQWLALRWRIRKGAAPTKQQLKDLKNTLKDLEKAIE